MIGRDRFHLEEHTEVLWASRTRRPCPGSTQCPAVTICAAALAYQPVQVTEYFSFCVQYPCPAASALGGTRMEPLTPPQPAARLVPYAGAAPDALELPAVDWHDIHPQDVLWSDLLNALRLNIGRTVYEQVLCPPIRP